MLVTVPHVQRIKGYACVESFHQWPPFLFTPMSFEQFIGSIYEDVDSSNP